MPISRLNSLIIGITMGYPAGIGPEIVLKALSKIKISPRDKFLVIGNKKAFDLNRNKYLRTLFNRIFLQKKEFQFLDLDNIKGEIQFGRITAAYGGASLEYLERALELIKKNEIDCLVTAPISKEALKLAGFNWPGHTEYLVNKTKTKKFAMMFVAGNFRVSLVTRHISLSKVINNLRPTNIYDTIVLTHSALQKYFGIKNPHIGVCAVNPHAGESGLLGREESLIIAPIIQKIAKRIKNISGPLPADTIFNQALNGKFDAIVAMYHDQALIPVKILYLNKAVNLTLGLPFIRTSPAHGTAYKIAGKNLANPSSMIEAIKLASHLSKAGGLA